MNKNKEIRVAVLIPARNEEEWIPKSIKALLEQNLKPSKIIVVNDGSSDNTPDVAKSFGCEVINLNNDRSKEFDTLKMSEIYNTALIQLREGFDYILELGADHILPSNYISSIIFEMERNPKLVIASGTIEGEKQKLVPRGSGRLIKSSFYKKVGMFWPKKYGAESFFVYKAWQLGYQTKVFEISSKARKTGTHYKPITFISLGKSCRALGYNPIYAAGFFIKKGLSNRSLRVILHCLKGWLSSDVELFDKEFRDFVNQYQKKRIIEIIKNWVS